MQTSRFTRLALPAGCVLLFASGAPVAQASEALANSNGCTGCHLAEARAVGPSFKEIAEKYATDKAAAGKLAMSIKNGSTGKWGDTPMPAQDQVSDADIKALATWILKGGK